MKSILLLPILFSSVLLFGQDKKAAKHYFYDLQDFESAVDAYDELLEEDPDNVEYNYNIAISYLNSNIDKSLAIPYLEKLSHLQDADIDMNINYYLGRAYALGYQFDKAILAYKKYLETAKDNSKLKVM